MEIDDEEIQVGEGKKVKGRIVKIKGSKNKYRVYINGKPHVFVSDDPESKLQKNLTYIIKQLLEVIKNKKNAKRRASRKAKKEAKGTITTTGTSTDLIINNLRLQNDKQHQELLQQQAKQFLLDNKPETKRIEGTDAYAANIGNNQYILTTEQRQLLENEWNAINNRLRLAIDDKKTTLHDLEEVQKRHQDKIDSLINSNNEVSQHIQNVLKEKAAITAVYNIKNSELYYALQELYPSGIKYGGDIIKFSGGQARVKGQIYPAYDVKAAIKENNLYPQLTKYLYEKNDDFKRVYTNEYNNTIKDINKGLQEPFSLLPSPITNAGIAQAQQENNENNGIASSDNNTSGSSGSVNLNTNESLSSDSSSGSASSDPNEERWQKLRELEGEEFNNAFDELSREDQAAFSDWFANKRGTGNLDKLEEEIENLEGKGRGLFTDEIDKVMQHLGNVYKGTPPIDQIPLLKKDNNKAAFIYNTDVSGGPGKHWIAVLIDHDKPSIEHFDSFGDPPDDDFIKYTKPLLKNQPYQLKVNHVIHQRDNTDSCGYHAMNFLYNRLIGGKTYKEASGFKQIEDSKKGEKKAKLFKDFLEKNNFINIDGNK